MIGSTAEYQIKKLLELLGYQVIRENVIQPSIDKIINFIGEPPSLKYKCVLKKPIFSPDGNIALSIKRGNFTGSDITDLLDDIAEARAHESDYLLQNINSGMLISNSLKNPSEINEYLERGIKCWDGSRMYFYSAKAYTIKELSKVAPLKEEHLDVDFNASYLRQWKFDNKKENTINGRFILFIDEHDSEFIYSTDHNERILNLIYDDEIKTMIEERDINVFSYFEIHVLGKANEDLVKTSYLNFSRRNTNPDKKEIGATFIANIEIIQYGVSPWAILLKHTVE